MNMSLVPLATQYPTIGRLQLSPETRSQLDAYKAELAKFADVEEIDDANFPAANKALAQAARLTKLIKADARLQTDELKGIARGIDLDVDRHTAGVHEHSRPLTTKVAAFTTRKEQERQAALAEKRRLEVEERARRAAEAARVAAEKEAKAVVAREVFRIEQERKAAAAQGEPLPPPMIAIVPSSAPANLPAPLPPMPAAELVSADLGRVTARPVVHVPERLQSAVRTRTTHKLVILDEAAIPMFSPNGALLRKVDSVALRAALLAGEVIHGAQLVEETTSFAVGG